MNDPFWPGTKVLRRESRPRTAKLVDKESNRIKVLRLLNGALSIARASVLQAEQQYCVAYRNHSPAIAAAALERANEAWVHADRIAKRIVELGGHAEVPPTSPAANDVPPADTHGRSLAAVMSADLLAQRASIKTYRKIASYCQGLDSVSQKMLDQIVEAEETSTCDLASLLSESSLASD